MKGTIVIIPAFNEEAGIAAVISAVRAAEPERIIVVDDGSTDETAARVRHQIAATACPLELIGHECNRGKGAALASGIAHALAAGARRIVTLDADGQHEGADLPRLERISIKDPGAVVVAARIKDRDRAPALRRFANKVADFWISWACGQRIEDTQSGFRLYPADLLSSLDLALAGRGFAFETGLLIAAVGAGAGVRSIAIATRYDPQGRGSHYRPWRDTWSIVRLVGGELLRRRMYLRGLFGSLRGEAEPDGGTRPPLRHSD